MVAEGEGRKDEQTHRLTGRARDNRLVHFTAVDEAGAAGRRTPGRRGRGRGDVRRAAPPGLRRAGPVGTPHPVRRRLGGPHAAPPTEAGRGLARPADASACPAPLPDAPALRALTR